MGEPGTPGTSVMTAEQAESLLLMIGELREKVSAVEARLARLGAAVRLRASARHRDRTAGTRRRDGTCLGAAASRQDGTGQ